MATSENSADEIKKRNSSICSLDEVSIADHEKAILSPRPVPFEPEALTGPYLAALERGNQSRSQSVRSSLNSLPSKNSQSRGVESSHLRKLNNANLDLVNLSDRSRTRDKSKEAKSKSKSGWKYLCCVSKNHAIDEENITKKPITKSSNEKGSLFRSFRKQKSTENDKDLVHGAIVSDKKVSIVDPNNNAIAISGPAISSLAEPQESKKLAQMTHDLRDTTSEVTDDISSEDYDGNSPIACNNLLGPLRPEYQNKKCLVLDLDETLVHSTFQQFESCDFNITVEIEGREHEVGVAKRPYLKEFLEAVGPLFECVMFTASLKKYADPVCDKIDPKNYLIHRLFRESCVLHQENYIKDLSRLGRDIDQVCIIDNSPASFLFQPNHAIHIITWYDDPQDAALYNLIPYLKEMSRCENIPDFLRQNPPPPRTVMDIPMEWFLNQQAHLMMNNYTADTDDENTPEIDDADINQMPIITQLNNPYPQMKSQYNDSSSSYQKPKVTASNQPKFIHQAIKQPNN